MGRGRTIAAMESDAEALGLYHRGLTYKEIADRKGWSSVASAHAAVRRAIADSYRLPAAEAIKVEEERLDLLLRAFMRVLGTKHYATGSSGRVAVHPVTGEPLTDDGPVIQAGMALLRVSESRRKLLGLDAPARTRVEVITESDVDAAIKALEAQVAQNAAGEHAGHPGAA